ncbi:MAG: right-handed parallel beta-helix repeat-containing protein, partial [Deltaproteobacteria bacterium]
TIQEAINRVPIHDRDDFHRKSSTLIKVDPTLPYEENLVINRDGVSTEKPLIIAPDYGYYGQKYIRLVPKDRDKPLIEFAGASRHHVYLFNFQLTGTHSQDLIRGVGNPDLHGPGHMDIYLEDFILLDGAEGMVFFRTDELTLKSVRVLNCFVPGGGRGQGIFLRDVPGLTMKNCTVANCGWDVSEPSTRSIFNHGVYIRQRKVPLTNITISNCSFQNNSSFGLTISTDENPAMLSAFPDHSFLIEFVQIDGNLFQGNANGFVHGAKYGNSINRTAITDNHFIFLGGSPSGSPQAFGMILKGIYTGVVQNNVLNAVHPRLDRRATIVPIETTLDPHPTHLELSNNYIHPSWYKQRLMPTLPGRLRSLASRTLSLLPFIQPRKKDS